MALSDNKIKIQALLAGIDALPEAGSGEPADPALQEKTVTPSASQQTVTPDSGYDGLSKVTINGDENLLPENIASGVSIFGVSGTFEGTGTTETWTFTMEDGSTVDKAVQVG